jgi:putative transposase
MFLLRPSDEVNEIIGYFLAVLSGERGISLHAVTALSNHIHEVLTDPRRKIIDFLRDFHSLVARHTNARFGDFENLWASAPTSRIRCAKPEDVIDKMAYTAANPVSSFLVKFRKSWPGLQMAWPAPPRKFKRPFGFLREETGRWPEEATLTMTRPPGYDDLDDAELAELLAFCTGAKEDMAREKAAKESIPFVGRRAVRRQSRYARPRTREPRFERSPRHACKDKWLRIDVSWPTSSGSPSTRTPTGAAAAARPTSSSRMAPTFSASSTTSWSRRHHIESAKFAPGPARQSASPGRGASGCGYRAIVNARIGAS